MLKFLFSRTFLIQLALAVLVVAGIILGAYQYLVRYTKPEQVVEVPDLNELDIVEAEAFIKQLHLRDSIIDSLFLPRTAGGIVVDQDPPSGSKVKEGRKIYLTISRYRAPMVSIPNIVDQTLSLALAKLKSYGFEIGELTYESSVCSDCVIAMTHKGKELHPGDKTAKGITIDLVVGMGESGELVNVPTLYGLSREEAQQLLNLNGLNLGASPYIDCKTSTDSLQARIFRMDPNPGNSKLPLGSPVNVFLTPDPERVPRVNLDSIKALLR